MSKLYEKYLSLKKENNSKYYLFKSGIFYIFLDDDAKKISHILNLKLGNLNENILKCGFPVNSLSKYMTLLKNANCDVQIVETSSKKVDTNIVDIQNNEQLQNLLKRLANNLLKRLANINPDNLSIKEVYSFLEDISKQAKSLIINSKKEE